MPPEAGGVRRDAVRHRLDAGIEHGHLALVLDQEHVHDLGGKPPWTSHTPSATWLEVRLEERSEEPCSRVERARHALLHLAVGGRQEPHRARELGAVVVGVVVLDLAVLDRQQVDALELDPRPGRLDALERPSAERARRAPAHGGLVAGRDHVQHLHPPVGHGGEGLVEEGAQLVGRAQVAVQRSEVVDAALGPAIRHRVHVTCGDGIEVQCGRPCRAPAPSASRHRHARPTKRSPRWPRLPSRSSRRLLT